MIVNPMVTNGVTTPQGFNPYGYMRPQQPMNGGPANVYQGGGSGSMMPPTQPGGSMQGFLGSPGGSLNFSGMNNSQPTMAMPGANVRPTPGVAPPQNGFVQHNTGGAGAFPSRMQTQMNQAPAMQSQMARIAALRGQM